MIQTLYLPAPEMSIPHCNEAPYAGGLNIRDPNKIWNIERDLERWNLQGAIIFLQTN